MRRQFVYQENKNKNKDNRNKKEIAKCTKK